MPSRPAPPPGLPAPAAVRRRLLAWYDSNRRDLPWRRTRDPWAILVSEVMLQQTTVSAVVPYYERFLERWPTPRHLARDDDDALLSAWAGLGYYRRARMLKQAAERVCEDTGRLPPDGAGLSALPGVGEYTAAAVASIAYGERLAAVDGNVERVLCRLLALPGDPRRGPTRGVLRHAAAALLAPRRPGDFNQALMELGATTCRPRSPACDRCPLRNLCRARAEHRPEDFPQLARRPEPTLVACAAAVAVRRGRVLLALRDGPPNEGFLELPQVDLSLVAKAETAADAEVDGKADAEAATARAAAALRDRLADLGLQVRVGGARPLHRHAITRYRITVRPFLVDVVSGRTRPPLRWADAGGDGPPLTTATRRILARSRPELFAGGRP